MKKYIYFILIALPVITSCSKLHSIEGNHQLTTEERSISDISQINSCGDFLVYIEQGSVYSLEIEAEENLLPYIETEMEGSRLIIDTKRGRNLDNHYPIKIFITLPDLEEVKQSGSGKITCDTLDVSTLDIEISGSGSISAISYSDNLDCKISGSGNIYITGSTYNANYKISGSGNIKGYDMESHNCFCDISGSGKIYANVTSLLDVIISGSGSVYYMGTPQVNTTITGSGSIFHN